MSKALKEFVAAEIASLIKLQDPPEEPFGFGTDISGAEDLSETMAEVDGFSTLALAQAIVRRLTCRRGRLPGDPNYGLEIRSYLNRGVTELDINSLGGQIRSEVLKDDRVDSLVIVVTPSEAGRRLQIEMQIQPFNSALGGFSLTLAVTSATVLIEAINAEP